MNYKIESLSPDNLAKHPQYVCFINPKHPSYHNKHEWLISQMHLGLRILLLYPAGEKKAQAYIEYTPGEHAWRAVNAKGYMFIHCLWTASNAWKHKGFGTALIDACSQDAKNKGYSGVAVLASNDAFLANADIFIKSGFTEVDAAKPNFSLLTRQFQPSPPPYIIDNTASLKRYDGLHLLYSRQCPWVARFVDELDTICTSKNLKLHIKEIQSPREAQGSPSPYGVFNLINNGKLLADHYISLTRFTNILKKERLI
jgi:hypothetical protein